MEGNMRTEFDVPRDKPAISFFLSVIIIALAFLCLTPALTYCEEAKDTTVQEVDSLLNQLGAKGEIVESMQKLYSMGPEIDSLLLKKLSETNNTDADNFDGAILAITAILSSRGYDSEILDILKSNMRDNDPKKRIASATILAMIYRYYAIRELASIVEGEKDPEYLNEQLMYEWRSTEEQTKSQILEVMRGKSQVSKDFVLALMKVHGIECTNCGRSARKWHSFLNSENKKAENLIYLCSELFMGGHKELDGDIPNNIRMITSSPDGRKIAFVAEFKQAGRSATKVWKQRDTNLWIMDIPTEKITKIQIPGECYRPSWSPQDDRILFQNRTARGMMGNRPQPEQG